MNSSEAISELTLALESPRLKARGTKESYLCMANQYCAWLGDRYPPGDRDVRLYISERRKAGWKEGSLSTLFAALKKLHLANKWEWGFTKDDRPLPDQDGFTPAFTEEELATLIRNRDKYSPAETFFLALSLTFGPRREELSRVTKKDLSVDHVNRITGDITTSILIHTAKKGPPRWMLIPDELLPAILDYKPDNMCSSGLSYLFHRFCKKGLGDPYDGYGFHSVRRTLDTLAPFNLANARIPLTYWPTYMRWTKRRIGQVFMESAMAGHYTHPEILDQGDPFSLDRLLLPIHPVLHYWRE